MRGEAIVFNCECLADGTAPAVMAIRDRNVYRRIGECMVSYSARGEVLFILIHSSMRIRRKRVFLFLKCR